MATEPPRHRVLLVREWDEQASGSGCCGKLGSEVVGTITGSQAGGAGPGVPEAPGPDPYARTRAEMRLFGSVYRALRQRYGEDAVDITVVDPRNAVWLAPAIWRDARRRGLPARTALRQVRRGTAARALVCDGVALASGVIPEPDEAVAAVAAEMEAATAAETAVSR